MKNYSVPIGLLSEEPIEANHKLIKQFRLNHARKTSRLDSNRDVFHRLLLNSDPLVSSQRIVVKKKSEQMPNDLKNLLVLDNDSASENVIINEDMTAIDYDFSDDS